MSGSLSFHYEHDRAGRIVARTEVEGASSTTLEYGYDAQGRLENVWRRTSPTTRERVYHYQYDANGNRIGWALPSGTCDPTVSTCTRVDEQDRLLSAGGVSYRYDLQGQLATRTEGTRAETFTYDMAGNLRRVVVREGATQTRHVEYAIDAFGRRVGRYVGTSGATSPDRFWVYQDGLNPVAQLNATGQLELLFLYGTQAHVPDLVVEVRGAGAADDVVYRVVTDQVGSVRRLVNVETGAVAASFDYSPFGVLEREDGALAARFPFRFAGGLWDGDTGLVRFGARDYDPRVGRWTAKDPILWDGGTTNLYSYVDSEPLLRTDPSGLFFRDSVTAACVRSPALCAALVSSGAAVQRFGNNIRQQGGAACRLVGSGISRMGHQMRTAAQVARPQFAPATGRVATRINVSNDAIRHIEKHLTGQLANNNSVFSISLDRIKEILSRADTIAAPVRALGDGQFSRIVDAMEVVGRSTLNNGGGPTTYIKVFTDAAGNLQSVFPL